VVAEQERHAWHLGLDDDWKVLEVGGARMSMLVQRQVLSELSEQPRWPHLVRDASRDQNCDQQLHWVVFSEAGLTTCLANPLMASVRLHEMTLCANVVSEGVSDAG
jgi:hypothetical protein